MMAVKSVNSMMDNSPPSVNFKLLNGMNQSQVVRNPILEIKLMDDNALSFSGPNGEKSELIVNHTLRISSIDWCKSDIDQGNWVTVVYPVQSLKNGLYRCKLTCWDSNFNQTVKNYEFQVNDLNDANETSIVYPNPTTDKLNFTFHLNEKWSEYELTIKLYNMIGQLLWEETKFNNSNENGMIEKEISLKEKNISSENSVIIYNTQLLNLQNKNKYQFNGKINVIR